MSDSQWRNQRKLLDKITADLLILIEKKDITDTLNKILELVNIRVNEEKQKNTQIVLRQDLCEGSPP